MAAINPANQNKAIAEIYSQNPQIKDRVKIVQLGWSKKALNQGKTRSVFHLGVASPEQANLLLSQGLLFESELHDCEVFEGECQVTQCFKCMEYGHIAKQCKNLIKCGFCAAIGHLSQDCLKKNDRNSHHCAICKKPGARHTAWARECPTRKEMVEKARRAYLLRPAKFQERTKPQESARPYESARPQSARPQEDAQGRAQERSQENAQERAQERAQEKAQEGSQERAQERVQERSQERGQERAQERTQDKFRGRTQESTQERASKRALMRAQERAQESDYEQEQEQNQGQAMETSSNEIVVSNVRRSIYMKGKRKRHILQRPRSESIATNATTSTL